MSNDSQCIFHYNDTSLVIASIYRRLPLLNLVERSPQMKYIPKLSFPFKIVNERGVSLKRVSLETPLQTSYYICSNNCAPHKTWFRAST